jgi:hypothetical protein
MIPIAIMLVDTSLAAHFLSFLAAPDRSCIPSSITRKRV